MCWGVEDGLPDRLCRVHDLWRGSNLGSDNEPHILCTEVVVVELRIQPEAGLETGNPCDAVPAASHPAAGNVNYRGYLSRRSTGAVVLRSHNSVDNILSKLNSMESLPGCP